MAMSGATMMSKCLLNSAAAMVAASPGGGPPELLTTMSAPPAEVTALMKAETESGLARSTDAGFDPTSALGVQ